jgi:3-phenylpropionate/cinnamic acid dioxygenase small subunit
MSLGTNDAPSADETRQSVVGDFGRGPQLRPSDPMYLELLGFLWEESATLDRDDLLGWLALLADDLVYTMPVRVTRKRNTGSEFDPEMMHFDEDIDSLRFRIRRFLETTAWSEDPPSRVRRSVTAVRAFATDDPDEYDVSSSLVLVRTQDDDFRLDVVTAERLDRIRDEGDLTFKLARRQILLDQSTVSTPNLAIFL